MLVSCSLLTLLAGTGCETYKQAELNHPDRIIHHNWWNYYTRGVRFLAQGNTALAKTDFERCLGLKPGPKFGFPKDLWRVRTYGLHFLEGYFPHRELGISLYLLGENERAIDFLKKSLEQTTSGRAKFYLNLAHKKQIKERVYPPPTINFSSSSQTVWTPLRTRTLEGWSHSKGFVDQIWINQKEIFSELAEPKKVFRQTITLQEGTNVLTVLAKDLGGQTTSEEIVWMADWSPPDLLIQTVETQGNSWVLEGTCTDQFGLNRITLDGEDLNPLKPKPTKRTVPIQLRLPLDKTVRFVAEDKAGNQLRTDLSFSLFQQMTWSDPHLLFAMETSGAVSDAPPSGSLRQTPDRLDHEDRLRPILHLSETRAQLGVFKDEFFLDGWAEDFGGLEGIRINGENMLSPEAGKVTLSIFARRLPLDFGTNRFEIVATDTSGNRSEKIIEVVRQTPEYLKNEHRLTVGLPPVLGEESDWTSTQIRISMEDELLREPMRFFLVERDEGWDFILREQELSLSDLADPKAALHIRKMLPAELLFMGKVIADGDGLTVYVKVVETEAGNVLLREDVYSEDLEQELSYKVGGLVLKIEQRFPLVEARVLKVVGTKATIDAGSNQGVREGSKFLVIPSEEGHEDPEHEVRKLDDALVQLYVSRARPSQGIADILPAHAKKTVRPGDRVYAR